MVTLSKQSLLFIFIIFFTVVSAQNVGINESNPTNALHVVPLSGEPLRIEGLTAVQAGDNSLLIVDPITGVVRYIGTQQFTDSVINTIFTGNGFNDSILSIIFNQGDTLLYNSTFISSLSDSIDTDVDSLVLTGNILAAWENGNLSTVDLSSLTTGGGADDWGVQVIVTGGTGFTGDGTTLAPLTFAEVDGVIGNEYNTTFVVNAGNLEITDGGGTIQVPLTALNLPDNDWDINGNGTGLEAAPGGLNVASGDYAIAAGYIDTASGYISTVSGGAYNTASDSLATIGGGALNTATAFGATIGGGSQNTASASLSTISGGVGNTADAVRATIGGGNYNTASGDRSVISGGRFNTTLGTSAVVGGGYYNYAEGENSTVAGGFTDSAVGLSSTVGGGTANIALGAYSTVSGGQFNTAQSYGEWVGGLYSTTYTPSSMSAWSANDRLFTIGNGTNVTTRSNALVVYKNGIIEVNEEFTLPNIDGTAGQVLTTDGGGNVSWAGSAGSSTAWELNGNSGTVAGTNFVGTTDNQDLVFKRNNIQSGVLQVNNTGYGVSALLSNTGVENVAVGTSVLQNAANSRNVGVGFEALMVNGGGANNTAVGHTALTKNTSGISNTGVGTYALRENTTGYYNTGIGTRALFFNTVGQFNTGSGYDVLGDNTSGDYNTSAGAHSMDKNTTGSYNTAYGHNALFDPIAGSNAVAIGAFSQENITNTATPFLNENTSLGYASLRGGATSAGNTGNQNTAIGYEALEDNTSGGNNTAVGYRALSNNSLFAHQNTAIGSEALLNNTGTLSSTPPDGTGNTAVGQRAMYSNVIGSSNVAMGRSSLYNNNTDFNIGIGDYSLFDNISGEDNIAIGHYALNNNIASDNIGIGSRSGEFITSGNQNTLLGYYSGRAITTGSSNTTIGYTAGDDITTGSDNTIIGDDARISSTSSNNTIIGSNASATFPGVSNVTIIGANTSNPGTIGDRVVIGSGLGDPKIDIGGNNISLATYYNFGSANILLGYDITVAPSGSTSDRNTFIGNNITAPAGDDNLIIGNGVTLPAGTNRTVVIADGAGNHKIYADDTGQVGIGTSTPTSKLHSTGAIATPILTNVTTAITLNGTHSTVVAAPGAVTAAFNLPTASTCVGRIYVLVNPSPSNVTVGPFFYATLTGASSGIISPQSSITLQSDGTTWVQIR